MTSSVFDTLAYMKKLRAAGVPEAQAEAQAEALATAVNNGLATKQDLSEGVLRLEGRVGILQWMGGFNIALTVTILFKIFA